MRLLLIIHWALHTTAVDDDVRDVVYQTTLDDFTTLWQQYVSVVPSRTTICLVRSIEFMPLLNVTLHTLMSKRYFELVNVDPLAMDDAAAPVCGMILLTSDFLGVDFDFLRGIAARSVFLAAFGLCMETYWRCEYFFASFHSAVINAACGHHSCFTMLRRDELVDKVTATFPADCAAFRNLDGAGTLAQWEQDIFVLKHFFPHVPRNLTYVDVGAFHPFKLSNTAMFEKCLGWSGICVEPNPAMRGRFLQYRPRCQLKMNCAWSSTREVSMAYVKDSIEATVPVDTDSADGPMKGRFNATCLSLEELLGDVTHVDYMSVDAENSELEIFRDFPFDRYDIRVISIEVQAVNYYGLDAVLLHKGYAKVAILGGDHVYAKLDHALAQPVDATETQIASDRNFHTYRQPLIPHGMT